MLPVDTIMYKNTDSVSWSSIQKLTDSLYQVVISDRKKMEIWKLTVGKGFKHNVEYTSTVNNLVHPPNNSYYWSLNKNYLLVSENELNTTKNKTQRVENYYRKDDNVRTTLYDLERHTNAVLPMPRNDRYYSEEIKILDVRPLHGNKLIALFQPSSWNRFFVLWDLTTKKFIKSWEMGSGQITQLKEMDDENLGYYVVFDPYNKNTIAAYSLTEGKQLARFPLKDKAIPFSIAMDKKKKWEVIGNQSVYKKIKETVLFGGHENALDLTNQVIPEVTANKIKQLTSTLKK